MRKGCCRALVGLVCLWLVGCVAQAPAVRVEETLAQLRTGRLLLNCREPCVAEWRRQQPQAAQLDAGGRWQDLALLLARVGYQDDLTHYYLGRAAEGLGYRAAAASYYRQSAQLSSTAIACHHLSGLCGGVALPRAASLRAVSLEAIRSRPRPSGAPPTEGPEPVMLPGEEIMTPLPAVQPPPPPASPPPRAAPPSTAPAGRPASEYIEPPPAAR